MPITVPVAISQNQRHCPDKRGQHMAECVFDCKRLQQFLLSRSLGKGLHSSAESGISSGRGGED